MTYAVGKSESLGVFRKLDMEKPNVFINHSNFFRLTTLHSNMNLKSWCVSLERTLLHCCVDLFCFVNFCFVEH